MKGYKVQLVQKLNPSGNPFRSAEWAEDHLTEDQYFFYRKIFFSDETHISIGEQENKFYIRKAEEKPEHPY